MRVLELLIKKGQTKQNSGKAASESKSYLSVGEKQKFQFPFRKVLRFPIRFAIAKILHSNMF